MTIASDTPTTDPTPTADEIAAARAVLAASTPELVEVEDPADAITEVHSDADTESVEDGGDETRWKHPDPEEWKYNWIDFHGDRLAVRTPTSAALTGYRLSQSGTNGEGFQIAATNRFITNHMSPESYARVIDRMVSPDEEEYTVDTLGELIDSIAEPAIERIKKEAEERSKLAK